MTLLRSLGLDGADLPADEPPAVPPVPPTPIVIPPIVVGRLLGRCANGFEGGRGRLTHAIPAGSNRALCRATFGRRSAGWAVFAPGSAVTCAVCRRRLREAR